MEPDLEAITGTLSGHGVQLVLLIARNAGILGIVIVRREHGSSARSQRSIHEAFQHAGVQHGITLWMVAARVEQLVWRRIKGKPLRDAQSELALFFHLLIHKKIFPVR